jgi:hypothetical protein
MASARDGPWLVSPAMWANCMRFVGDEGVPVGELERLARTATKVNGMQRWGYITLEPAPSGGQRKPRRSDFIIRATPKGRKAQECVMCHTPQNVDPNMGSAGWWRR